MRRREPAHSVSSKSKVRVLNRAPREARGASEPSPPCGHCKIHVAFDTYVPKGRHMFSQSISARISAARKDMCLPMDIVFKQEATCYFFKTKHWGKSASGSVSLSVCTPLAASSLPQVPPKRQKSHGRFWVLPGCRQKASHSLTSLIAGTFAIGKQGHTRQPAEWRCFKSGIASVQGFFFLLSRFFFSFSVSPEMAFPFELFHTIPIYIREETQDVPSTGKTYQVAPHLVPACTGSNLHNKNLLSTCGHLMLFFLPGLFH